MAASVSPLPSQNLPRGTSPETRLTANAKKREGRKRFNSGIVNLVSAIRYRNYDPKTTSQSEVAELAQRRFKKLRETYEGMERTYNEKVAEKERDKKILAPNKKWMDKLRTCPPLPFDKDKKLKTEIIFCPKSLRIPQDNVRDAVKEGMTMADAPFELLVKELEDHWPKNPSQTDQSFSNT